MAMPRLSQFRVVAPEAEATSLADQGGQPSGYFTWSRVLFNSRLLLNWATPAPRT